MPVQISQAVNNRSPTEPLDLQNAHGGDALAEAQMAQLRHRVG